MSDFKKALAALSAGAASFLSALPAYAYTITSHIQASDGPVNKIILDTSDPVWIPLKAFAGLSAAAACYIFIKDYKQIIHGADDSGEKTLTSEDIMKGTYPASKPEPVSAMGKGTLNLGKEDPAFSIVEFIKQAECLYAKSLKARQSREWGAMKFTIPHNLCLNMQNHKVKTPKYMPLATIIEKLESYNTGSEKATIRFRGIAERPEGNTIEEEVWDFERFKGVKSKYDKTMSECPECGSTEEPDLDGKCPSCGIETLSGKYGWVLHMAEKQAQKSVDLLPLPPTSPRREGSELTIVQENLDKLLSEESKKHPELNLNEARQNVISLIAEYYKGLLSDDEHGAQICTDNLLKTYRAIIPMMRKRHAAMPLLGIQVLNAVPARILYDSQNFIITFRIWANLNFTSAGKEISNLISDYVTVVKTHGNGGRWKIEKVEPEAEYKP